MSLLPPRTVPTLEGLEARLKFAAGALDVTIGVGAPRSVLYTDLDGSTVSVSIRRGTAVVALTGDDLSVTTERNSSVVTGSNVILLGVSATGTTRRTAIAISASGGDGRVVVGTLSADGSLASIEAPTAVLTGRLDTGGPVRNVSLERAENAALSLGSGAGASSLDLSEVTNSVVVSAAPLRRVSVGTWGGGDAGSTLNAPSIARLTVGAFRGSVTTTSAGIMDLDRVETTTIVVTEAVQRLSAGSVTDVEVSVGHSIGTLSVRDMQRARMLVGVRPLSADERAPASLSDFTSESVIRNVRIAFSDLTNGSVIAAHHIAKAALGLVDVFGPRSQLIIASDRIGQTTARTYQLAGKGATTTRIRTLEAEVRHVGSVELRAL